MKEKMVSKNTMVKNKFGRKNIPKKKKFLDFRKKYWGTICTIFKSKNFAIKEIVMKKNTQSSMEYHIFKEEFYYIQKGKLKVGMRIGRAENKSIILKKGELYHIPAGLMHMRIALEDTTIIEWSNKDTDEDSNIVEDGLKYKFRETK